MTQHQQWIEVQGDGAAPQVGWRCDGCRQVKWQEKKPTAPCELCTDAPPVRLEPLATEESAGVESAAGSDGIQAAPKKRGSRNPGLTKGEEES